jgi:hypothetical protein
LAPSAAVKLGAGVDLSLETVSSGLMRPLNLFKLPVLPFSAVRKPSFSDRCRYSPIRAVQCTPPGGGVKDPRSDKGLGMSKSTAKKKHASSRSMSYCQKSLMAS